MENISQRTSRKMLANKCFISASNSNLRLSSWMVLILAALLLNLMDFNANSRLENRNSNDFVSNSLINNEQLTNQLTNQRSSGFLLVEGRVVGRMARMWYIKKQLKKLNKKLKNTTITLPIITRIPVYDHSYYPASQVTQISQPIDSATNSYYTNNNNIGYPSTQTQYLVSSPAVAGQQQPSTTATSQNGLAAGGAQPQTSQQTQSPQTTTDGAVQSAALATSASNPQYHFAYMAPAPSHHHHHQRQQNHYRRPHPHNAPYGYGRPRIAYAPAASHHHQIINEYPASPPSYVDEAGGLYGQYGNAYGRYDGGYHTVF